MATFFDQTKIAHWQAKERTNLRLAFDKSRKRIKLTVLDTYRVRLCCRDRFLAINSFSRLEWGEAICLGLAQLFCDGDDGSEHHGDIFFVTLCDKQCVRSSKGHLREEDLTQIKNRLLYGLRGLNYFAVVDPALFVNWQVGFAWGEPRRCVSWHLHALVWGISRERLRAHLRKLRRVGWYEPLAPGLRPTQVKLIRQGRLPRTVGYLLKSPISAYRLSMKDWVRNGSVVTDADGVVQQRCSQSKSKLRPGERLTVYFVMRQLCLDDLAMAGGDGKSILANAKRFTGPSEAKRSRSRKARRPPRALASREKLSPAL